MTTGPLSRRSRAIPLVPLALLSVVWAASLVSASATANSTDDKGTGTALPDGTPVPNEAIEAPASVPVPGVIAPALPDGPADAVVSGASRNGIPAPAIAAYQRAAQILGSVDESCNIPWELIAGIGRVESDHGRYGGSTLTDGGVSTPGIYGIALNGKNGTQAMYDTDGGELDKDTVFDRAVGPMQFIPSTWHLVQVDADADSKRNPQDMDDAALATAVYLCSGKDNLSTRKGQEAAAYRYNHSQDYVNLVLRIMEAYSSGDYSAVPSGTLGGTSFSPSYSSAIDRTSQVAQERKEHEKAAKATARGTSSGSSSSGSTGAATPGGGSTGGSTLPDGGGDDGDGGAGGVATDSGEPIGGATGGGSGDGGTPSPSPSPPVMSIAEATENCLAGDPLLSGGALDACIALGLDDTETAPYREDTGAVEPSLGQE